MSTPAETALDRDELLDRFTLKALVEACLVLEEGEAALKDIDLGMMAGAGIMPPPFQRADQTGLDVVLDKLELAVERWGDAYEPPAILRRLVVAGRLGIKSGQGFYPYPRPDPGWLDRPVKLETRGEIAIAWLDRPPANSLSPEMIAVLREAVGDGQRCRLGARAGVRLGQPDAVLRRRRHQGLHEHGRERGTRAARRRARAPARHGALADRHHRRGQRAGLRGRLRAGHGLRLPDRGRVGELRAAGDQPRHHPRLRGHPAAAPAGRGRQGAGAQPDRRADRGRRGVRVRARHTGRARPRAAGHGAVLGAQARRPGPAGHRADQARRRAMETSTTGIAAEKAGFERVFASEDAREGIAAFLGKRTPRFRGR